MADHIAYVINQYPKTSHSFIRREILALEQQGFVVQRIAMRGWDVNLVDQEDQREQERTKYALRQGHTALLLAALRTMFLAPGRFFRALFLTIKMGQRADKPWPYHLVYLAEACLILPWLKEGGARHMHAHFGTNSAEVAMLASALGGPPYSFTVHGPEEFDMPEFIHLDEKIRRSQFVVAVSSYGRSQLFRWVGHKYWSKVKVVHCGLEAAFYDVDPVPIPAARRLVCVARLAMEKGVLLLVEAAHRLAKQEIDFELVLVGDGPLRGELDRLVTEWGLAGRVRITGWLSGEQVRDEILAARALVSASFAEGLPVVIMEAMALRRPVLATYVGGVPELVRPGETGWLVHAGDLEQLIFAMRDVLAQSSSVLQCMGEAGYSRVLARHNIDIEAAKLKALFREANQ